MFHSSHLGCPAGACRAARDDPLAHQQYGLDLRRCAHDQDPSGAGILTILFTETVVLNPIPHAVSSASNRSNSVKLGGQLQDAEQ